MTTGMPELGSKISLISKADIRYEGRLFTVDPQECTIALASVRSFGTEERDTQFPVPAQNQVYDYILFRGSDIKDIRVVNSVPHPQPLNDPAIMQLSVPPTLGGQQYQQHPILGHMGHNPYGSFMPLGGLTASASTGLQTGISRAGSTSGGASKPNFIGGGASRSTTPASMGSRRSMSIDQGTQAGGNPRDKRQVKPIQPPRGQHQQRVRSNERRDSQNRNADNQDQALQYHHNQGRVQNRGRPQYQHNQGYQHPNNQGYQQHQNNQSYHHQNNQGGYQQYNRGGWNQQRGIARGRGRGKGAPFRPGGATPGQQGGQQGNKKTLKFDSEYDFEQANTEFEELRCKLAKVKLDEATGGDAAAPATKPEVNGDVPVESEKKEKDDSGNETGAGETEQEEDQEVFYDKSKSFFDKISCEAVERAKGKMQRTDWRQERKLNSETFGVAATRRGSYRGRGGFRGGFRGSYYRGGYNKYPQQQQQRRNNEQQQNNQHNQQAKDVIVYNPLTSEEAIAKKQEETKTVQEETNVQNEKLGLLEKLSEQESDDPLDAKKLKENENIVDAPACVGQ
ncbi:unnamed protein product [Ceutorhynchus assimilis]|uniref:Uncharacterized protein n=1 Tax=Ceutorhynchus assimilis TaxID=467358 RepID=A0A9P0GMW3_9CUCU|nr:unnamed protein product [Ceutorhynchus assimilis]